MDAFINLSKRELVHTAHNKALVVITLKDFKIFPCLQQRFATFKNNNN